MCVLYCITFWYKPWDGILHNCLQRNLPGIPQRYYMDFVAVALRCNGPSWPLAGSRGCPTFMAGKANQHWLGASDYWFKSEGGVPGLASPGVIIVLQESLRVPSLVGITSQLPADMSRNGSLLIMWKEKWEAINMQWCSLLPFSDHPLCPEYRWCRIMPSSSPGGGRP